MSSASRRLPRQVSVTSACSGGKTFAGVIPLRHFKRLSSAMLGQVSGTSDVQVHLVFSKGADRKRLLSFTIEMAGELICQRCLEEMPWRPVLSGHWLLESDEASAGPGSGASDGLEDMPDSITVTDDQIDVWDAVEEELLLALPIAARHEEDCGSDAVIQELEAVAPHTDDEQNEPLADDRQRPFAQLDALLKANAKDNE